MFWTDHDLSAWGWVGMTLGMVAFWALVIGLTVYLVRGLGRTDQPRATDSPGPERLLSERFARGEIDDAEYASRLATLRGAGRPVVRS